MMLKIENLSYRYPQRDRGTGPFDLSAGPGEIVHVRGPSGSGKSTLARCITGIIPHLYRGDMSGEVTVAGMKIESTPLWQVCEKAGFVFQNPSMQMLSSSVEEEIIMGLENLGLGRDEIRDRVAKVLAHFDLEELKHRDPRTLSGGEQQKLALAAVIARRPAMLVLDEPLSMLDVTAEKELITFIKKTAKQGTTIIVFEHRTEHLSVLPGLRTIDLDPEHRWEREVENKKAPSLPYPESQDLAGLKVNGLSIKLGKKEIFQNFQVDVNSHEVTAIVGRNGSGKTTLLRAMAGLQDHEGTIEVDGTEPDLGMVYQNADLQLFNATVKREILYGQKDPDMVLYDWLLDMLKLRVYEDTPPLMLSEGEKKRVALASVLIRKPVHGVLLDEPSLGQDHGHKEMLIDMCRAMATAGKIVLMTTHDLYLASMADRLVLLGQGGIVAEGSPVELFKDEGPWHEAGLFIPSWMKKTN